MKDRLYRESPRTEKRSRFLLNGVIAAMRACTSNWRLNLGHHHLVLLRDATPPRRTALLAVLAVLAVGRVLRPSLGLLSQNTLDPPAALPRGSPNWWTDAESEVNAQKLEWRRDAVREQCRAGTGTTTEAKLWRDQLRSAAAFPTTTSATTAQPYSNNTTKPQACRLAFFDLGANVGDSLGKFISVGIPSCDEGDGRNRNAGVEASSLGAGPPPTDFASHTDATNRLVRWAAQQLAEMGPNLEGKVLRPEHYCYFGVEGNPVFTDRLRRLQEGILRTQPRPVRWAQFFTETVAAAADGPTVLYLDTKNEARNYWGSSLLHSHKDVQASANPDGQVYQAQVKGITLTTLLRERVVPEHGSHVLIKMDIEGSEYGLLNEARDSGILCELTEKAIRVDLMVEVHSKVKWSRRGVCLISLPLEHADRWTHCLSPY